MEVFKSGRGGGMLAKVSSSSRVTQVGILILILILISISGEVIQTMQTQT